MVRTQKEMNKVFAKMDEVVAIKARTTLEPPINLHELPRSSISVRNPARDLFTEPSTFRTT
jgi:hypothetical protein